jgi:hypothetical protein
MCSFSIWRITAMYGLIGSARQYGINPEAYRHHARGIHPSGADQFYGLAT